MAQNWVTSDSHFDHENIIKYGERPFANKDEMNEMMVDLWNQRVKPEDTIYHLGDVTMHRGGKSEQDWLIRLIHRLNGHKRLLLGNHDHFPIEAYVKAGFEKVRGTGQWFGNGIILSHYPIHPSCLSGRCLGCVHGHIHQNPAPKPIEGEDGKKRGYVNVCVERTGYAPILVDEVREQLLKLRG